MVIQEPLLDGFPSLPWLPIQLGFPPPFHIHAKN